MDSNHLLVVAGCSAIAMLIIASVGSMLSEVMRIRYAYGFCHWLRERIFQSYAKQPYAFYLHRKSADLYQRLWDIQTFIGSVFLPIGEVLTRILLVALLMGTVFLVQPWVALGAIVVLGGFYLIVFLWLRPRTRAVSNGLQFNHVGFGKNSYQFLHGIKTVLVHGRSRHFIDQALEHSAQIGNLQSKIPIYSNGPRYMIEPIVFGGLVAIVIVLALQGRPFSDILPNLSVMALAGYRLMPALQLLYSQLVLVAANNYTLTQLEEEIFEIENENVSFQETPCLSKELNFNQGIILDKLTFFYPNSSFPTLKDFSLTITKNESIGIAGPSGSGKSTLVDLILGLHTPQSGSILIDDVPLSSANIPSWRHMIGYVPQDIYLLDETIEANIAFGIDPAEVDQTALREAVKGAQILNFIEEELPQGFQTMVGERGVRLSGGQRQRIGLARALYHKPQVLILDEATSALDHETEKSVMETIDRLSGQLTMISIAHRISTLEKCDRIVRIAPIRKDGGDS